MGKTVSFCIAPHQDDWLLFYGARGYADASRVVFIYVTAGDAGRSDGWWEARERGALAASHTIHQAETLKEISYIQGHPLVKYLQKESVSYCMRLPDGLPDGAGSSLHCYQSLIKLRDQRIPMTTVDGSTVYASWEDFCATLTEIIQLESQEVDQENIWIHAPEYDSSLNPNDHADHQATADAVRVVVQGRYNCSWWLSYYIYYCPLNLSPLEVERKRALFLSYSRGAGVEPNELEWACWGHQEYCRKVLWSELDLCEGSLQLAARSIEQFLDRTVQYQRCGVVYEQDGENGFSITNQLTQKSVLLNPVAKIFWDLLKTPCTLEELHSILSETHEDTPLEAITSLLELLLNAKLIRGRLTDDVKPLYTRLGHGLSGAP